MPDAPARGFPEQEFTNRTARAQAHMGKAGLAGMLLMSEAELRYFSGFRTLFWQSPTRPWFLFVPISGKPVAVIPDIGAALMQQTWIDDIRTWPAPMPKDDGISLLTDLLAPLAHKGGCIGVMKGHETALRMPLGDYERLMANLPGLNVTDCTDIVRGLRMVKSDAEIEKLRHVCNIGSATFAEVPKLAHPGQAFEDTFRAFRQTALRLGADDVPYLVGGADQGGYHDVISPPSRRPLQKGDVMMLDTGMTWDGYFCDFDRNWAIGHADDAARRAYDVLWRATEAGLSAARPGATCADLYHAMQAIIAELDTDTMPSDGDVGRLGHGLGMQLTEWPSHVGWDHTVIEENMVLTLEPSLSYGNGRIMVHEENIVVGTNGAELLSQRAAPDLPVIT